MEDEDKTKTQLLQKMVELQRRNAAELALVNKLNDAVNHGQSLKQIIRLLSKEVKKSFACKGVTILLLDANKSHLILQNSTFTPALIKRLEKLLGIDIPSVGLPLNKSGYYAEILQTAQPRLVTAAETIQSIINEFIQEAAFENERIRKRVHSKVPQIYHLLGIKSGISMPLISSEGAIGILDVFTNNIFDESDVEWVRRIAAQFLSIIKRKQLENDLKKDEKLLKETQKISKVGGWEIDVVSGKWKVTDTIYHIYQIPVGQKMSPEERMQFYPDYVRPKIRKAFDKLLQEGKPYDLELPFVTAKGKKRWIRTTAKAEKKAGKVVRVVGNLMDITESRRARDAAIENEKRYHLLFENSPAPLWEENFTGLFHYFAHLKKSGLEDLQKFITENPHVVKECINKIKVLDVNKAVLELHQAQNKKELLGNLGKLFSTGSFHIFKNEVLAFARGKKEFVTEAVVQTLVGEQRHILLRIVVEENCSNDETTYRGLVSTVDVTDRVKMEKAIADREQRLQKAQHVARMGFLDWDLATNDIFLSDEVYELYGLKKDSEFKTPEFVTKVVYPDDLDFVKREFDLAVRGLKRYNIDHRIVRPGGDVIWINAQAELARDETGAPLTLLGIVVDITARKQMEETLKLSEERFRLAFQTSPDSININRMEDGLYVNINDGFTNITGYTREDAIGKTSLEINIWENPNDRARLVERLKKSGHVNNMEAKFRRKDGRVITGLMSATIIMLNKVPHILSITRSIEELKQAERALKENEQRFRAMLDQAGDAMFLSDLDGKIIDVNIMACTSLGYSAEELLSMNIADVDEEFIRTDRRTSYWEHLVHGKPTTITSVHLRKDGTTFPVEMRVGLLDVKGKTLILGFARDISKRIKAKNDLLRHREQLQALSAHLQSVREEERTYIAREMHDELGQRLTVLKMDVTLLQKELVEKEDMHMKTQSMLNMIDDTIRVVQKMSSELKPSILEGFGLVAEIKQQVKEFKKHSDIKYELSLDIKEDYQLPVELATAIFRVFQESITNVLRHAHATKIKIEIAHTNDDLLMRIQDNGIGISQKQLFDPSSFGIIGMRERMYHWNGKVHIKSAPGKGTTIIVNVPWEEQEKTLDD